MTRWAVWQQGGSSSINPQPSPELGFIEPLLRRRLSPLARAALHVANVCAQGFSSAQVIYASRHGELTRTVELLHNLARNETLSPATFSLSVLNAAAGVFSIARADTAPAVAIAAGRETFGFGLLETYARATLNPGQPILFIYADAPAPPPLERQSGDPDTAFALAMLIDTTAETMLETVTDTVPGAVIDEPQAVACTRVLAGKPGDEPGRWSSSQRHWEWRWQHASPTP